MSTAVSRPQRWQVPFDPQMAEKDVDRILSIKPFSQIDQAKFPKSIPLRGVLLNEAKITKYRRGDIVVRRGDYGNSAFFIMEGSVRVISPTEGNQLPDVTLGHKKVQKKSWKESVQQVWKNTIVPEFRARVKAENDSAGLRVEGDTTKVYLQDVPGVLERHKTFEIQQGEFFGEIAALGRTPRTATIFSDNDETVLLEIKWQGLRDLRKYTPAIKEHIDRLYRERSLNVELQSNWLFRDLTDQELQQVADQTQFKSIGGFDWHGSYKQMTEMDAARRLDGEPVIYEEGGYPESMVMIRAGFARLSEINGNGHRTISYLGKGQLYGFAEIAHNWRSTESVNYIHTLRGLGYVDILVIPSHVIVDYVLPKLKEQQLPPLFKARTPAQEITKTPSSTRMSKTDVLEFLVENRYINGTATMLVNLDRCTRCDDCVRACASAHDGNPRFVRDGKKFGNLMVAHACMHCQDPVCMIGCPTGAIQRQTQGQVVINDETCVGCSTCANSCPYENITMVEVRAGNGQLLRDETSHAPILKATKCDLCVEQLAGPSCQNACPHDALIRADMRDTDQLMDWIRR